MEQTCAPVSNTMDRTNASHMFASSLAIVEKLGSHVTLRQKSVEGDRWKSNKARLKIPIVDERNQPVLSFVFSSNDKEKRHLLARLMTADESTVVAEFERTAQVSEGGLLGALVGMISFQPPNPCKVRINGTEYGTIHTGLAVSTGHDLELRRAENPAAGIKFVGGAGFAGCCCPYDIVFAPLALAGPNPATMVVDNDSSVCSCCIPNAFQRVVGELGSVGSGRDVQTRLDLLLVYAFMMADVLLLPAHK